MTNYHIHQIIEYLLSQVEFPFDSIDVEESLDDVLVHFGIDETFTAVEEAEIRRYILPRGINFQISEMQRLRQQWQVGA
ncbi:hypothetical protein [Cerasicoccus maritimus]|uniref:hypothetical protein n=1 Tax=Cerasicoccus maritimus TaxID=490089 RepID=UPI0028525F6E|nr:hypothetical protein [Cerasicoccus maritimus]